MNNNKRLILRWQEKIREEKIFLDFWSYPEIVLAKNKETKYELIKSYFTLLLYKDLLKRYWNM